MNRSVLAPSSPPTTSRAVIDLDALAHNARVLADAAGVAPARLNELACGRY